MQLGNQRVCNLLHDLLIAEYGLNLQRLLVTALLRYTHTQ